MNILYDARWIGNHGIGRFARELLKRLPELNPFHSRRRPWDPLDPALLGAMLWCNKPDLFFSPGYNSPLAWPSRYVFSLHDLNHLCVRDNSNELKRAYYRYIIRPACHRARVVLTVSEYSRREIASWAGVRPDKIINVGNGVGEPFSPSGKKYQPGFPYLFYAGSRKPHKNLLRLLKAYSLSRIRRDVRLVLSGVPDAYLEREIECLGLTRDVGFVDVSADDDLAAVYRGALAFVFPSLYEGFGLPPLEAMACGTPVLTSNVCSLPEVTNGAALLVNPTDVDEIAAGLCTMVEDHGVRMSLTEKGLIRAEQLSWSNTAEKTRRALEIAMEAN